MRRWINLVGRAASVAGILILGLPSCLTCRPAWALGASYSICTIGSTGLVFGAYTSAADSTTTATVTVTCTGIGFTEIYTVGLNGGGGGSIGSRSMAGPSGPRLGYQIYTSNTYGTVWGDGTTGVTQGGTDVFLLLGTQTTDYTAYGRIVAGQQVVGGTFNDMITITLTF